jgi:hypothetical protein
MINAQVLKNKLLQYYIVKENNIPIPECKLSLSPTDNIDE